jgi:hypothetical protein
LLLLAADRLEDWKHLELVELEADWKIEQVSDIQLTVPVLWAGLH